MGLGVRVYGIGDRKSDVQGKHVVLGIRRII